MHGAESVNHELAFCNSAKGENWEGIRAMRCRNGRISVCDTPMAIASGRTSENPEFQLREAL